MRLAHQVVIDEKEEAEEPESAGQVFYYRYVC